jgi:uncharacterized protein (TIGR02246 family)
MGATTQEHVEELMTAAYQAKDAEVVAELFEEDAVFASTGAGFSVVGRAAIVEKVKANFAMDIEWFNTHPVKFQVVGDWAFSHSTFQRRLTLPDGTRQEGEGRVTVVLRRGADGNWRIVIDPA